ncbi:MAG: hypothetical protein HOU81_19500 [Hamadaea sp.]|uniref:hypothetical protein n=1 Tax=Hamadaea sp. TaxID=2024425 RepID=UPI00184B31B4|nr:hypothetical protein [Hamadaea sp.]NUR73008.1 hypothetical protein [Hamadaea sp.]NUT18047.1 hypothetical protein [Hamadaea sp.]
MTEGTVQLILDASALTAYGRNPAVGELLTEIESEAALVVFSTGSLAQAAAEDADRALLELLLQRDSCESISPMIEWEAFGDFLRRLGHRRDAHDAFLVFLAFLHRAYILTGDPDRYTVIHKAVQCIPLQRPWSDGDELQ